MHQDQAAFGVRHHPRGLGVVAKRGDVVDDLGPRLQRGAHRRGVARVHADRCGLRQFAQHRQDAGNLLLRRHGLGAGASALAADIEQVGAGFQHRMPGLDRGARVEMPPAIGKAVGRDVHDAHHQGPANLGRRGQAREAGDRPGQRQHLGLPGSRHIGQRHRRRRRVGRDDPHHGESRRAAAQRQCDIGSDGEGSRAALQQPERLHPDSGHAQDPREEGRYDQGGDDASSPPCGKDLFRSGWIGAPWFRCPARAGRPRGLCSGADCCHDRRSAPNHGPARVRRGGSGRSARP